jgi:hypothetical protein
MRIRYPLIPWPKWLACNTYPLIDMSTDMTSTDFKELKRRARKVKARPRRKDRAGGPPVPTEREATTDSLPDTYASEKRATTCDTKHAPIAVTLTREDAWRAAGDIEVTIIGGSINPRIIDILLPGSERGRAIIKPEERRKFGSKKPLWVRREPSGKLYRVVGGYSIWGIRHS